MYKYIIFSYVEVSKTIFGTYVFISGAAKAAGNLSCVACQEGLKLGISVARQTTT